MSIEDSLEWLPIGATRVEQNLERVSGNAKQAMKEPQRIGNGNSGLKGKSKIFNLTWKLLVLRKLL